MKNAASLILALLACSPVLFASTDADTGKKSSYELSCFHSAVDEIRLMLEGITALDYERAVFLTENAWYGNRLTYGEFQRELNLHESRIKALAAANRGQHNFRPSLHETAGEQQDRYDKALTNWAIFTYLTDTVLLLGENGVTAHMPYFYSYDDPLGSKDWKNAQVIHLLTTRRGNCYAMTSLFRMLSGRLKSDANIATAPGHVFIQHQDAGGATFNVELATRSFPGTGTIETLTHSTDESVRNGLSMRSLDLKQSVALCLVYLAKGHEHRFGSGDGRFALACAELALQHDPLNLNAMLLQAEAMEDRIIEEMDANGLDSVAEARRHPALMSEIAKYEELIGRLYSLGYREMPIEMKNTLMGRVMNDGESPVLVHNIRPDMFGRNGQTGVRYASLSGGVFDETYETKAFEKYSRTVWNTKAGKVERFETEETLYNSYPYDPVVFAWSVDPMTHQFTYLSPYVFAENNPIKYIDLAGLQAVDPISGVFKKEEVKVNTSIYAGYRRVIIPSTQLKLSHSFEGETMSVMYDPHGDKRMRDLALKRIYQGKFSGLTAGASGTIGDLGPGFRRASIQYSSLLAAQNPTLDAAMASADRGYGKVFRHIASQGLLTKLYGADFAKEVGDFYDRINPNEPIEISYRDLLNNAYGREFGSTYEGSLDTPEGIANYLNAAAEYVNKTFGLEGGTTPFKADSPAVLELYKILWGSQEEQKKQQGEEE